MSQANYIIICAGRGEVEAAKDMPEEAISAAMNCAARLVSHVTVVNACYQTELGSDAESTITAISRQQHKMMDAIPTAGKGDAETLIADMFRLLDLLERQLKEGH
jgi:hypothetical protein